MSTERSDKARDEFLSESQEIVEQLNRDLLAIAAVDKGAGRVDPDLINDAFRAVHSLKGLAGLFGVSRMSQMSHHLENLLDSLRLGKIALSPQVLDLLFEAVELYQNIIAETGAAGPPPYEGQSPAVDDFVARLDTAAFKESPRAPEPQPPQPEHPFGDYALDPLLLAVLTEYEEHRLRENIREGRNLYRIQASFPLQSIDQDLESLKAALKPVGEVITYIPGAGGADPDRIDLEVMLGSPMGQASVLQAVTGIPVDVVPVPRGPSGDVPVPSGPFPSGRSGDYGYGPRGLSSAPQPSRAPRRSVPPAPGSQPPRTYDAPGPAPASATTASGGAPGGAPPLRPGGSPAPGDTPDKETTLKSVAQTVRVDIRKLDHLMNIVGELALARTGIQTIQNDLKRDRTQAELARLLQDELRVLSRKLDELQAGILEVRMVPLGQVFDKLSRVVRKISRDANKEIRFVVSGADTELDKLIIEELSDPLMHVIRNAIDHGIETARVRQEHGKPEAGTVAISAEQRGNHVVLEVEDDGAGIDAQGLVSRAVQRGLLTEEQARDLSRHEVYNLIFLPGLSTRDVADEMSGRGVGMDVVKTNIARLSGIIDIDSESGQGTRLTITLPITLAIIQALVIRSAGRTYAIPLNSVMESLMLEYDQIRTIERREVITLREQTLPLLRLDEAFQLRRPQGLAAPVRGYVVVVALAQHRLGILVDDLLGQQDIVIKSLGRSLQGIPGIAGATELGGQQTVLVLDVRALAEEALPRTMEAA